MTPTFRSTMCVPPGGKWFYEDGDILIESPSYHEAVDQIRAYFAKIGKDADPAAALAEHMCPRMPRLFCSNFSGPQQPTYGLFLRNSSRYYTPRVESADVISRRMDICASCPKCSHGHCVTCRGIDKTIYERFKGRRASLPQDRKSGVCECAGAYVMAVATVCLSELPEWKDVPDTCWRNEK